jgi:hypothetical protein
VVREQIQEHRDYEQLLQHDVKSVPQKQLTGTQYRGTVIISRLNDMANVLNTDKQIAAVRDRAAHSTCSFARDSRRSSHCPGVERT